MKYFVYKYVETSQTLKGITYPITKPCEFGVGFNLEAGGVSVIANIPDYHSNREEIANMIVTALNSMQDV